MTLDFKDFTRKPLSVKGVQVTDDNIEEVAAWCNGEIREEPKGRYIHVQVQNPLTQRQTKAFASDWVLQSTRGFKIYTQSGLRNAFDSEEPKTQHFGDPEQIRRRHEDPRDTLPVTDSRSVVSSSNVFAQSGSDLSDDPHAIQARVDDVYPAIEVDPRDQITGKS